MRVSPSVMEDSMDNVPVDASVRSANPFVVPRPYGEVMLSVPPFTKVIPV